MKINEKKSTSQSIKLTKAQQEIVLYLRSGWELTPSGDAIVAPQGFTVRIRKATMATLIEKGIIVNGGLSADYLESILK